ncbi:winged helix-turn-helix transcriptional regulator [Candidatus Bathyarchaeota archaeon]|nr:winged helix-turn-helix transcriptional regulator [Candidatus Bathyarchaeota archaeon]
MKKTSDVSNMKKGLSETCNRFFTVLGNPTRLATLETLLDGPKNVTQIAETLGQEQSMISHNLRPLVDCRFVYVERRGKERIYSVNHGTVDPLFKVVENHAVNYCPSGGKCLAREG